MKGTILTYLLVLTSALGFSQSVIFRGDLGKIGSTLSIDNGIYFDIGRYDLKPESKPALDSLVGFLQGKHDMIFQLTVFTKDRFPDPSPYSFSLSHKRAQSIADYLIEQGVLSTFLKTRGVVLVENVNDDMSERIEISGLERRFEISSCIELTIDDSLFLALSNSTSRKWPAHSTVREELDYTLHLQENCLAVPIFVGKYDSLNYKLVWNSLVESKTAKLFVVVENLNTTGVALPDVGMYGYQYFDLSALKSVKEEIDTISISHFDRFSKKLLFRTE
ncbi:MAG: hypothetical protein ACJATE_002398 [Bacteroidia bacterium]|jgi:hypothetical protein